jgi:hypothetical protein
MKSSGDVSLHHDTVAGEDRWGARVGARVFYMRFRSHERFVTAQGWGRRGKGGTLPMGKACAPQPE